MEKALLVFQTDFTYKEGAVPAMYGVVKSVDRQLEIITATHEIPQYDIYSASYRLAQYYRFWPVGTVFVSVVDPGVGTKRKACVALSNDGYYFVTPDNGALTHINNVVGVKEVREIDESRNRLKNKGTDDVAVFHGRDLFGYCAAKLASGKISFAEVGEKYDISEIKCFDLPNARIEGDTVVGCLEICDPNFGNLWSNIPKKLFNELGINYGDKVEVKIYKDQELMFDKVLPYYQSFGFVGASESLIYYNELGKIALAKAQANLLVSENLGYGMNWTVEFNKRG